MRRTQVSQFAWRTDIDHTDLLTEDHPARYDKGYRLAFEDQQKLGITLVQLGEPFIREDIYRGGVLLAVLLKRVIPESLCNATFELLKTVNGDPKNRPGIIGEKARQHGVRADGKLSPRIRVSEAVIEEFGGKADLLGYYRYTHPRAYCDVTNWTKRKLALYKQVRPFIAKVDEVYRTFLPEEHRRQMEYVDTIPEQWRIPDTAFTTLYVLKNAPTATHTDTFDYKGGFGCMASLGDFKGGWLCFPRFRIAVDYRPGDVLLADVHQVHANFPIYENDLRVSCVFFCRAGQAKCPA